MRIAIKMSVLLSIAFAMILAGIIYSQSSFYSFPSPWNTINGFADYVNVSVNSYNLVETLNGNTYYMPTNYTYLPYSSNVTLINNHETLLIIPVKNGIMYHSIIGIPWNQGVLIPNNEGNITFNKFTVYYNVVDPTTFLLGGLTYSTTLPNATYIYNTSVGLKLFVERPFVYEQTFTNQTIGSTIINKYSFFQASVPLELVSLGQASNIEDSLEIGITSRSAIFSNSTSSNTVNNMELTNYGFYGSGQNLNGTDGYPYFIYMDFNSSFGKYTLFSNQSVLAKNGTLANSTKAISAYIGTFPVQNTNFVISFTNKNQTVAGYPYNYALIPAYSTNTLLSFVNIANPRTISGETLLIPCQFQWLKNFSNVTFNTTFRSINQTLDFNSETVHYLVLNLTYLTNFGVGCNNVFFDTNSSGSIPYAILNCNLTTQKVAYVLSNETNESLSYNSFTMYFDNKYSTFYNSNYSLKNSFIFVSERFFANSTNEGKYQTMPYLLNLNHPVASGSNVILIEGKTLEGSTVVLTYNTTSHVDNLQLFNRLRTLYTITEIDSDKSILFWPSPPQSVVPSMDSNIIGIYGLDFNSIDSNQSGGVGCPYILSACYNIANYTTIYSGGSSGGDEFQMIGQLGGNIQGQYEYLYSTEYTNSSYQLNDNYCVPLSTPQAPNTLTTNSLISNTNINPVSNSLVSGNITLAQGVTIPIAIYIIIALFLVIFTIIFANTYLVLAILILVWLLSYTNIQELPLAMACTLLFLYLKFVKGK